MLAWLLSFTVVSTLPPVPGAVDPALTKAVICNPNWSTKSVRPPRWFTDFLKREQMREFHLPGKPSAYEEDHLIPLELGGAPRDPNNLWPEPWVGPWGAHTKDQLENQLHRLVCAGKVDLAVAQHDIATNWIAAFKKYMGVKP